MLPDHLLPAAARAGAFVAQVTPTTLPTTNNIRPPTASCQPISSSFCNGVWEVTHSQALADFAEWLWSKPFTIALIFLIAFFFNRIVRKLIRRSMNQILTPASERARRAKGALRRATPAALFKTTGVNMRLEARVQTLTTVFRSIASVVIWFIAVVSSLQVFEINLASLVAISSVAGVAVGFGAQNIVRDFLAGTFFVLEDQFGVGDTVDLGHDAKGTVEELTLRATRVRDVNGTVWHVPNGQILRVANKSQEWARAVLDIEVDGGTDYAAAATLMTRVADTMAGEEQWSVDVLTTPEIWGVESFTENGYTIRLVVKTRPGTQFGVMRELRIRLLAAFDTAGIVLPGAHWATEHERDLDAEERAAARGDRDERDAAAGDPDPAFPHPKRGAPGEAG